MSLISIIKDGLKVVGSVIPGVGKVADIIDAIDGADEEQIKKIETDPQLLAHEVKMKELGIEEFKATNAEALEEIKSSDKFTSRARPTAVYAATGITTIIGLGMTYRLFFEGQPIPDGSVGAIVTMLLPLWGNAGYYTYKRTQEKTQ